RFIAMEDASVFEQITEIQQFAAQDHDVLAHQEQRIQQLEAEVHELMETVHMLLNAQNEEKEALKKKLSEFDGLHGRVKEVVHTAAESSRMVTTLEKRMDNVKKDAFSGVAISVIAFSFLVIISLFLR
ncbi:MAG: hypothetical protein H7835_09910, partial [Magnetococcus sp. XQGC-1]